MDSRRFDSLVRALSEAGSRRGLLGFLATLPLLGGLVALLASEEGEAKGRRKRRKKSHHHRKKSGNRSGNQKKRRCKPESKTKTCSGKCGSVKNNCKKVVDCGSCDCPEPCAECFICQAGPNTPGACVVDPQQQGEPCGSNGQVCQAGGACACDTDSCPACTTCGDDGACAGCDGCCAGESCVTDCGDCKICDAGQCTGCPDCCDTEGVCQDGESDAACGRSGACDVCTGQKECQGQQCVCVPACDGKVCGSDGCGDICGPGCDACETCLGDGTCSAPCGGSGCCAGTTCEQGNSDTACGRNGESCAPCTGTGVTCGGGGTPGVCGCTPIDPCTGGACGTVTNNCGQRIDCDPCPPPQITAFTAMPTTIDRGASQTSELSWTTTDATTCSIDNGVGSVPCTGSTSVGPSASTTYALSASGAGGGPVTAQAAVTVRYCHAITTGIGRYPDPPAACPVSSTYCTSVPIVSTSSAQAQAACDACFGAGACVAGFAPADPLSPGGPAAAAWVHTPTATYYLYESAFNWGRPCTATLFRAGNIVDSGGCQRGRWAPF